MYAVLSGRLRRAAGVAVVTGLLTGGLVLLSAPQAAASTTTTVSPVAVAYVDSALPSTTLTPQPGGQVPVGAINIGDGLTHVSKSYFTVDADLDTWSARPVPGSTATTNPLPSDDGCCGCGSGSRRSSTRSRASSAWNTTEPVTPTGATPVSGSEG